MKKKEVPNATTRKAMREARKTPAPYLTVEEWLNDLETKHKKEKQHDTQGKKRNR